MFPGTHHIRPLAPMDPVDSCFVWHQTVMIMPLRRMQLVANDVSRVTFAMLCTICLRFPPKFGS